MKTNDPSTKPVQQFFEAFGKGDFNGILNSFNDQCKIIAVRDKQRVKGELYGTYYGQEGLKEFLKNLSENFNTREFSVNNIIGKDEIVFADGSFTHELRTTGKLYHSNWSLKCKVKEGKVMEYHFYEDSMGFLEASR